MINNARQLSRSLVGIYHYHYPVPLNPALVMPRHRLIIVILVYY